MAGKQKYMTGSKQWRALNERVMKTEDVNELEAMLREEKSRKPPRVAFLTRIHARLTRMKTNAERKALVGEL